MNSASLSVGWRSLGKALAAVLLLVASGHAQDTAGLGTSNGLPPGYTTNPFRSPALNPWLNPYARTGVMSREQLFLTFLAARQQAQVAQIEQRQAESASAAAGAPPALGNPMMRPGGVAAGHYFGRARSAGPTPPPYGRHNPQNVRGRR